MRAALQVIDNVARALQHVGDSGHMPWFARMARAQQCDLMLLIAETLDATSGDERQRLQRLQCTARERQRFRVPGGIEQPAMAIDHGHGTRVHALDHPSSRDFGERGVGRRRGVHRHVKNGQSDRATDGNIPLSLSRKDLLAIFKNWRNQVQSPRRFHALLDEGESDSRFL